MNTENKSHARKPANAVCLEHDASAKFWVETDKGEILKSKTGLQRDNVTCN